MLRVFAIDPGMTHTGLALVDETGVSCTQTIKILRPCGLDNNAIFERAREIAERLQPILAEWKHDLVVMEGWKYYSGLANEHSATQTPLLVGWLAAELRGEHLCSETLQPVFQTSDAVFNRTKAGNIWRMFPEVNPSQGNAKRLADLMKHIPGGDKAKDEHQRAAVAHAVWFIRRYYNPSEK